MLPIVLVVSGLVALRFKQVATIEGTYRHLSAQMVGSACYLSGMLLLTRGWLAVLTVPIAAFWLFYMVDSARKFVELDRLVRAREAAIQELRRLI